MKKLVSGFLILFTLINCSPKGPQTYSSPFIGKSKEDLVNSKGMAKEIKNFGITEAYIYKNREEYFGNIKSDSISSSLVPKKIFIIEYIYYINENGIIYKYQVWKKRIN